MPYIGNSPQQSVRQRYYYTATAGQTTFTGADIYGLILKYTDSEYVDVFLNGVLLQKTEDYTATTRTSVVLTSGAQAGDLIEIISYGVFSVSDTVSASRGGTFTNAVNVNSNLAVTGNTTISGILTVTGNTNITGNTAITGALSVGGNNISPYNFVNKIINGAMAIDQRNAGASQTFTAAAALAYCVDRWYGYCTGANVTGQRVAGTDTSQYRYRFTGAASVTAIGFGQRIEAINCYDLNNTTAILSVDLANSVLTTVTWTAYYANTADTFGTLASPTRTQIATGTFTVTSTVTRYSTTISIPSAATTGIEIVFTVGAQTSGTWTIGNVQLEAGSVATPFERRSYGQELALCQRYYQTGTQWVTSATNNWSYFPVQMRATPTVSGGGAGFATALLNQYGFAGSQTTGASQTLIYTIEL